MIHRLVKKYSKLLLAVALFVIVVSSVHADDAPSRYDNDIAWTKQVIEDNHKFYDDLAGDSQAIQDVTRNDLVTAKKYFDDLNRQWEAAIPLFEQNKETEARAAQAAAQKFGQNRGRWRDRLAYRQRQVDSAPTEEWMTAQRGWTPPEQAAQLTQLCEARKKSSETWGMAAEAMTPDADDATIAKSLDSALLAAARVEVADFELNWGRQNHDLLKQRNLSTELNSKVASVEDVQTQISQTRLAREELDAKMRSLIKERDKRIDDANHALALALKAKEDARNQKP